MSEQTKACAACKQEISFSRFQKDNTHPDGLRSSCRSCSSLRKKKQYYTDHDASKKRQRDYRVANRDAHRARAKAWLDKNGNRERINAERKASGSYSKQTKATYLKFYYGMTPGQELNLRNTQKGLCAICSQEKPLRIDHCHVKGNVRGLLCHNCNVALGLLKEDPQVFKRAAFYIESREDYDARVA